MRRYLLNGLLVALIIMCLAATYWLLSGPVHLSLIEYVGQEPSEDPAAEDGTGPGFLGDLPNWLQFLAALVMAWFSYFLWQLGKTQADLLKKTDTKAETNIELTRKSVDAYVEAERGLPILFEAHLNRTGCFVEHGFENVGRSPIEVLGLWTQTRVADMKTKPRPETGFAVVPVPQSFILGSGRKACTPGLWKEHEVRLDFPLQEIHPDYITDMDSGKTALLFVGVLRYRALPGMIRRYLFTFITGNGQDFVPLLGKGYTMDFPEPAIETERTEKDSRSDAWPHASFSVRRHWHRWRHSPEFFHRGGPKKLDD